MDGEDRVRAVRKRSRALRLVLGLAALSASSAILHRDDLARLFDDAEKSSATWVEDRAHLLSAMQRADIAQYHTALLDEHEIDYRVLTLDEGGDINLNAHRYFDAAEVGALSTSGRGLLLVIDTELDRVRLEVSTSLEGVYTDAFVAYVQNRQMVPFFQRSRVADGILATTELIVSRAQEAEAGRAFAPPMPAASMGGGATAVANIGAGAATAPAARPMPDSPAIDMDAAAPLEVVELYLRAMAERDARPDLPIYSAETVLMLKGWVVTAAQMDGIARTYRSCTVDAVRVEGERAAVRYRVEQRTCAPYFLRRENGGWRLDLTMMSSAIRFNHNNCWRFQTPISHAYEFAFADWRFDRNGFPQAAN